MKKYIILFISLIIDGLIPNITLYQFNNLTWFTPLFTVISLIFLYDNKNFIHLFLISILLYSGLYMSNLLLTFILFFTVLLIIRLFKNNIENNLFTTIILILLVIVIYEGVFYLTISFINSKPINILDYIYKVSHSLILNLLYGSILFYIFNKKSSKLNH